MRVYNTLSGKKEELKMPKKGPLRLFVCGPTVYDSPHLGHARTYLFFDAAVRYLKSRSIKVAYLQNITDIEDKIIERAKERATSPAVLARKYEKEYLIAMKKLGIATVTKYARATGHIKEIVKQIETLIKKEHAYIIEGDGIYFDIKSFFGYGNLSRRTAEGAEDATSRIDDSVQKKNKGDFALWKFSKPGEPTWKSPWGEGRPGWHIEDTAITEKYFGPQYDIHGGGMDLKFPHHEAEIAQQEAASGKAPLAKLWMHTGFVLVEGKKMSKSLKNFVLIEDFLQKYSPDVLRLMALSHHYRTPLDYSEARAKEAESEWERILYTLARISGQKKQAKKITPAVKKFCTDFHVAMEDDFNTPAALAAVHILLSDAEPDAKHAMRGLKALGFVPQFPRIPQKIKKLAAKREKSRGNKEFVQSDALRKEIEALGYTVEDTPRGPFLWPQKNKI